MKHLLLIAFALFVVSCSDKKQVEYEEKILDLTYQLNQCSEKVDSLSNTPQSRLFRAKNLFLNGNLEESKKEYQILVNSFAGTEESSKASSEIKKIGKLIAKQKKAEQIKVEEPKRRIKFGTITTYVDGFNVKRVNVWDSPYNKNQRNGVTVNNERVTILDEVGDYYKIKSNGRITGYVMKDFVILD